MSVIIKGEPKGYWKYQFGSNHTVRMGNNMTERNNTCVASAMQRRHQNFMKLLELTYEDFNYDFLRLGSIRMLIHW